MQKLLKEKKQILHNENINNNDEGIKEKLKNILQDLDKIIKIPAKTSEIATNDARCGLNPKYFINVAGGKGNLL